MPASRASMSTSSQPLSTMGEMTITSILCRINSRTASSWACWSLSASMAVRSTPNSRAASRIDWLFASRQPLSVPTWCVAHADRPVDRTGRAVELALVAVHVFPRDRVAAQDDLLGHAAHLPEDVERKLDRLPAAGRAGDRLVDFPAADELQPAVLARVKPSMPTIFTSSQPSR